MHTQVQSSQPAAGAPGLAHGPPSGPESPPNAPMMKNGADGLGDTIQASEALLLSGWAPPSPAPPWGRPHFAPGQDIPSPSRSVPAGASRQKEACDSCLWDECRVGRKTEHRTPSKAPKCPAKARREEPHPSQRFSDTGHPLVAARPLLRGGLPTWHAWANVQVPEESGRPPAAQMFTSHIWTGHVHMHHRQPSLVRPSAEAIAGAAVAEAMPHSASALVCSHP